MPFHVSIELMNRTGHCKFRLDCRTKKKAKDGPLALPVQIPLGIPYLILSCQISVKFDRIGEVSCCR